MVVALCGIFLLLRDTGTLIDRSLFITLLSLTLMSLPCKCVSPDIGSKVEEDMHDIMPGANIMTTNSGVLESTWFEVTLHTFAG